MEIYQHKRPQSKEAYMFNASAERPLAMLSECPAYAPTPMNEMPELANQMGVAKIYMKDESTRLRLGSFKGLGGAFAVSQMICQKAGNDDVMSDACKAVAAEMTFTTASAGNHGLSVAAGARIFGAKAVVVLCEAVPEAFADRIRGLGAEVIRTKGGYDESVAFAISNADEKGWLLLADGSWEGYTERPAMIVEGYMVLPEECKNNFTAKDEWPTHILLQAGVGGLAASVAAHVRSFWPVQPEIIVVEPDMAPCLMESCKAGKMTRVEGGVSNMGRLDCKEVSLITFHALKQDADSFVTVSDDDAQAATDLLAEHGIESTPSAAAPVSALQQLKLPADSRVMLIVSEGPE